MCLLFLVCLVWLQDALRVAGAFPVLVAALTAHQGHAGVAYQACFALGCLAANNAANQVTSLGGRHNPAGGGGMMHVVWHVTGGEMRKEEGR